MTEAQPTDPEIDWRKATFEGATREAMRRWADPPLEQILAAQEEIAELAAAFGQVDIDDGKATTDDRS